MTLLIGGYSREEYLEYFFKKLREDEDARSLLYSHEISEDHLKNPTNIIAGSVFCTLGCYKNGSISQYVMNKRLLDVLDYTEEEFEERRLSFSPEGFFLDINCFSDKAKDYIKEEMESRGFEYPTLTQEAEITYLNLISRMTRQCVTELTNLFERGASFEVKQQYRREILGEPQSPTIRKSSWTGRVSDSDNSTDSLSSSEGTSGTHKKSVKWADLVEAKSGAQVGNKK